MSFFLKISVFLPFLAMGNPKKQVLKKNFFFGFFDFFCLGHPLPPKIDFFEVTNKIKNCFNSFTIPKNDEKTQNFLVWSPKNYT